MFVYVPDSNLVPKLNSITIGSGSVIYTGILTQDAIDYFKGDNTGSSFFNTSVNVDFSGTAPLVALGIDFDISNENFDLFWSNFGYVGNIGKNIYLIIMPDIKVLEEKFYNNPDTGTTVGNTGIALSKVPGKLAVIVDPYDELADEISVLEKCVTGTYTMLGSTDSAVKAGTVRSQLRTLYSLISASQITQTYEIYSFNVVFGYYTYAVSGVGAVIGTVVLAKELPINTGTSSAPFKLTNTSTLNGETVILSNELVLDAAQNNSDWNYINEIINAVSGWRTTEYTGISWIVQDYMKYPNAFESTMFLTVPHSVISDSKNVFTTVLQETQIKRSEALQKLVSEEGAVFTRYWGDTLKSDWATNTSYSGISDLYDNPTEKSSIVLKSFMSQVINSADNEFIDPAFTDFYFILTPGINLIQDEMFEIYTEAVNLAQSREEDSLYLVPLTSFVITSTGEPDYNQIYSIDNITSFVESNLPGNRNAAAIYPDAFITHPFTGELTLLDTSVIYLIKWGELTNIWQSPAGARRGVLDFIKQMGRRLSKTQADRLYSNAHINPILRPTKFSNPQIEGNRTLYKKGEAVKSALSYVNVKGAIMYIIRALRDVLYTFKFEPNNPLLFLRFQTMIRPVLDRLVNEGALYAYQIQNLTTDQDINAGRFVVGLGIQPTREVEIIRAKIYVFAAGSEIKFE